MKRLKEYLLHYFTPQPTNNFRAKTLHIDFLSFYMIAALLFALTYKNIGPYFHNVLGFATDISVQKLFELTNKERTAHSLGVLSYNPLLEAAAREKAADMFAKNYWSHFGPDGTSPWNFILKNGYQYEFAGENLAKNFLYSQGVVDAWMASPSHRENILNGNYTEVGYAIVNGILNGEETTLVVQMFGKPLHTTVSPTSPSESAPKETSVPDTLPVKQVHTAPVQNSPAVLGQDLNKPKINLLFMTLDGTYIFIFFFSIILLADFYIVSRLNVVHLGGKHIAHFIFIGFIAIFVLVIMKRGAIL